jgi:hypothetical protein
MSERLENSQNNKSEEFVGLSPAKKKTLVDQESSESSQVSHSRSTLLDLGFTVKQPSLFGFVYYGSTPCTHLVRSCKSITKCSQI